MAVTLMSNKVSIAVRANQVARLFYHEEFGGSIDDEINVLLSDNILIRCMGQTGLGYNQAMNILKRLTGKNKKEVEAATTELAGLGVDIKSLLTNSSGGKYTAPEFPAYDLMPVIWAMAKAEALAQGNEGSFPTTYRGWLIKNGDFDVNDCKEPFEDEIRKGFFRQGDGSGQ